MSEALVRGNDAPGHRAGDALSLPMLLGPRLVAGVLVRCSKTVTSIQDNVLAFHPRAAAIFVTFALTFPWMLRLVTGFSQRLFERLPDLIR